MVVQAKAIIERHVRAGDRLLTFEELVEMTRRSPRRSVDMIAGELTFTQLGEIELSKFVTLFIQLKIELSCSFTILSGIVRKDLFSE